jgi:hypothetical protein
MRAKSFGVALAALAAFGCGTLRTEHVTTGQPGAPIHDEVRVVMQGQAPPGPVEEVAIVQSVGTGTYNSFERVIEAMRERARRLGCDVLVNVRVEAGASTTSGSAIAGRRR